MGEQGMAVEFGTVAEWTADVVDELGDEYAIVAGCRGSGDPALLDWLAQACEVGPESALLDVGAGLGGAAAWAAEAYGVHPVLVDPMEAACRAVRRMFGRSAVCARGETLPYADDRFDVVWCIGVLCTVHDKPALLRELCRVLRPGGSLGMMVLVAGSGLHSEVPEGNEFPSADELRGLVAEAGFAWRRLSETPSGSMPTEWRRRADRVDELLAKRHGDDPRWQESEQRSQMLSHLLTTRQVTAQLVHAVKSVGSVP